MHPATAEGVPRLVGMSTHCAPPDTEVGSTVAGAGAMFPTVKVTETAPLSAWVSMFPAVSKAHTLNVVVRSTGATVTFAVRPSAGHTTTKAWVRCPQASAPTLLG